MATSFTVRQFFALPTTTTEEGLPTKVYIVTGSVETPASGLLLNESRTNLSQNNVVITNVTYSGTSSLGWFPGPSTATSQYVIIVGGNPNFNNTAADGRAGGSKISCWGATGSTNTQGDYDTAFINLASQVNFELGLGYSISDVPLAKDFCIAEGFYYQYPVGLDGQSPNTGDGSDVPGP